MIKIVIDTLGGDRGLDATVVGGIEAVNKIEDVFVTFTGNENDINEKLATLKYDKERVAVVNATEVIDCNDKPTEAIKTKKDSSLMKAVDMLRNDEADALVSTGSTGAILAAAVLKIGRIHGVKRPGFCPIMPTMNGKIVGICDSGANVDCDSLQLKQFAQMGSLYLNKAYGVENPKVALLNIGVEEEKGDALRKETYGILKETKDINFVGNMESRELLKGEIDLVVCDGFSGNVLLKSTEGACLEMLKMIKKTFTSNLRAKIGALILKKDVYKMKDFMDYNNYGGAVLLGCKKTVVKGHGSSKAVSVFHCVEQAYNMEKNGLREAISNAVTVEE